MEMQPLKVFAERGRGTKCLYEIAERAQFDDQDLAPGGTRNCRASSRPPRRERGQVDLILTDPPYNTKIANNVSGLGRVKHADFLMCAGEKSPAEFTAATKK